MKWHRNEELQSAELAHCHRWGLADVLQDYETALSHGERLDTSSDIASLARIGTYMALGC